MRYNNEYILKTYGKINYTKNQAKKIYGNKIYAILYYTLNCMENLFTKSEIKEFEEHCVYGKFTIKQIEKECDNMITFCKDYK